jgi:dTDP-4-dehydrorhamnose 3,5-epimerase
MKFSPTPIAGSYVIDLDPFLDERGWFTRFYCKDEFLQIGHNKEWVQMNHSMTYTQATVRGMHFQCPPYQEIKIVRCIAGVIFDVIIDLRKDSDTFLHWFGCELSAANRKMLYIPQGFAHGFQSLTENCQLIYLHSEMYTPGAEGGIRFNDPAINVQWPLPATIVSPKDSQLPLIDSSFKGI